ncbi:uncharacterized protein BCR38DRAFT_447960 [Pseudomassariella vexata]|uniref:Uncharacterized protein n=1 Tax=Pseudomassariella vexata TaxID=1141098 RepID=A0A1Y2DFM2_9PEZI|nr:uncharacterized protein BCR38DRAFT_447960 [Pseudomassariella vexata]ORY58082.1 hypothetical protein BCR38DRAFT_447960 [Pseudomassariella vexata]
MLLDRLYTKIEHEDISLGLVFYYLKDWKIWAQVSRSPRVLRERYVFYLVDFPILAAGLIVQLTSTTPIV